MASANFLTVKTHLSELKSSSEKDTLSEVSIIFYQGYFFKIITV